MLGVDDWVEIVVLKWLLVDCTVIACVRGVFNVLPLVVVFVVGNSVALVLNCFVVEVPSNLEVCLVCSGITKNKHNGG